MKKFLRSVAALLFAGMMIVPMFGAAPAQAADNSKMLFLYVGKAQGTSGYADYPTYTVTDINNMTNVNKLVIVPSPHWETYKDGVSGAYSYSTLNTAITNMVATIQSSNKKNLPIYISTPGLNSGSAPFSTLYTKVRDYLANLKTTLGTNWSYVEGVYFNCEQIYGTVDYNNLMGNAVNKLANDLSYYTHSTLSKKFMWVPIYSNAESIAAENIKKVGHLTNRTNIFDYVLLQPNYYFNGTCTACQAPSSNLTGVSKSITAQAVTYRDGVVVTPRTSTLTKVGVQMEIDGNYVWTGGSYATRYNAYSTTFDDFVGLQPISYYAGNRDHWNTVKATINSFYGIR